MCIRDSHLLDHTNQVGHELQVSLGHIDPSIRKQMGTCGQQFAQRIKTLASLANHPASQRLAQLLMINRTANAAAIENRSGIAAIRRQGCTGHVLGSRHGVSKNARTSSSSRVRFIGGRLRQMRLP